MTHDPLCRISKAIRDGECCADDPLFGYPCDCRLITKVRQDMLAKCITAVEALGHVTDCMWSHDAGDPCPHEDSVAAMRALEEAEMAKPLEALVTFAEGAQSTAFAASLVQGQRKMLVKCIEVVAALPEYALRDTTLTALRDLQEKP